MTRRSRVAFLCVVWLAGCEPTGSAVPLSAVKRPFALKACVLAGNRRADCGTLMVPERRDLPGTRYVALPVVRVRAAAPAGRDPVFWLEGGPGMRNVSGDVPSWLAADRDYVMVGYRGVDGSVVLACPEVERALRGMGPDLLGPVSLRVIGEASG
ncbi:MAG: hypothetical protein JNJ98_03395, partial [Gemmatimonadetes bacterium]|nr:hypothetical protein [Gemmatimonadota bacterium]